MHPLLRLCAWLFLDGATVAVATTPLLLFAARDLPAWQVAVAGGTASAAGSVVQLLGFRWMLAHERPWMRALLPSRQWIARTLARHPSVSFLAIAIARATPLPDAPFKLAAALGRYPLALYFAAVLLGALPYYFLLVTLGQHLRLPAWAIVTLVAVLAAGFAIDRWRAARERAAA